MADSPWGAIQDADPLAPGIDFVTTASHGGIRVAREVAHELLTPAALKCAIEQGEYFFFEEDCDYVIVLYEIPSLRSKAFGLDCKDIEKELMSSLRRWNASYLKERGIIKEAEDNGTVN